jgi:hypothetical protein
MASPVPAGPPASLITAVPGLGQAPATKVWRIKSVPSPHREPDGSWSSPLTPAEAPAPAQTPTPGPTPRPARALSPTKATAGRAGGPGFQSVRAGEPASRPAAGLSVWQKSQHLWSAAGIQWDQPPAADVPPPPLQTPPQPPRDKHAPGRHARPASLPPDREPTPWPGRLPLPLGAPVFAAPVADSDDDPGQHAWIDQDVWSSHDDRTDDGAWTEPGAWTDQDSWAETSDRWDDEQPPIRPRPSFLLSSADRRPATNDTLLLDSPARRDSARPGSRRPGARAGLISRRTATIGVPAIVLVAVAALALALLTGHGPKSGPLAANQAKTQASGGSTGTPLLPLTAVTLATYPGQQQRGVFQTINRIVASGNTIVTMGAQTSGGIVRQQFFVSTNGGTSWRVASVAAPDGSQPPLGYPAALLAGGPGGWAAVGSQAIWTSRDGLSWTLAATHGISPDLPGDSVWVLTKTAAGFLAAGASAPGRNGTQAVIWASRNGVTWQRMTASQVGLPGPGETVRSISYATWHGNDTVISGTVAKAGKTYSAAWLSTNGGSAWTRVTIPAGHGAGTTISGLGFDNAGLIAIRAGRSASGAGNGISYFSPNGLDWQYSGAIDATAGWTPGVVKGSDYGFVVTGTSASGQLVAFTSTGTGTSWQQTGTLGSASAESVVGATVAPASTIIAVGYTAGSKVGQQPVFLEAGAAGSVRSVSLAGIAGAVIPELIVSSTAVADGQQIAVGSANGYPAIWRKTAAGDWTLVSSLSLVSASPGLRALTSVTHGPAGWLAVGAPGPVILTSADGTNWGVAGGNITQHLAGVAAVSAASGPAGYIIVGKLVARGGACVADVWWSPDLAHWTRAHDVNDATGSSQVLAVAAGTRGFVSAGSHDAKPAVWITSNGRSWQTIVLPLPAGAATAVLQQVAINGNRVVALGQAAASTAAGASTVPFAEFSADAGQKWQQAPFSSPGAGTAFTALTADSAGFTAAGTFGAPGRANVAVWTSVTGASWAPSQASDLNDAGAWQISALAPSRDRVTGIGSVDTQQGQETVTLTLPAR